MGAIWFVSGVAVGAAAFLRLFCPGIAAYDVLVLSWPFLAVLGFVAMLLGLPVNKAIVAGIQGGNSIRSIVVVALALSTAAVPLITYAARFVTPGTTCIL